MLHRTLLLATRKDPLPLLLVLAAAGMISGCGESDSVVVPEISFEDYVYGQDETLEIVTWNLEHFAKNNQTTVDYLVRLIGAMNVDVIALATFLPEITPQ